MTNKHVSSENFLMSVLGHLALGALLVTSFVVISENVQDRVVADRVIITEIDLNNVKITRDLTELYNIEIEHQKQIEKEKAEAEKKKAEAEKATQKTDNQTEGDGDVVAAKKPDNKTEPNKPATKDPAENPNAPRAKTTVRVNRETLTRTMTISVTDAFRAALTRCWVIDKTRDDLNDLRIVVHLTMFENGTVRDMWVEQASQAQTNPAFEYALKTIQSAIDVCQPFSMLPRSEFDAWKEIQVTFYPASQTIN